MKHMAGTESITGSLVDCYLFVKDNTGACYLGPCLPGQYNGETSFQKEDNGETFFVSDSFSGAIPFNAQVYFTGDPLMIGGVSVRQFTTYATDDVCAFRCLMTNL